MRAAAIVMHFPGEKDPAQVLLAEWDEEIQALAAEAAEQMLAERVRRWRADRRPEDAQRPSRSRLSPARANRYCRDHGGRTDRSAARRGSHGTAVGSTLRSGGW